MIRLYLCAYDASVGEVGCVGWRQAVQTYPKAIVKLEHLYALSVDDSV
jgi:hypothetical protein